MLLECERANDGAPVTLFEITTAAAFLAFSRTEADVLLLEVGLGGRLDATNVIEQPLASIITRISYDHREFLGDTLQAISAEKAGIFKKNAPAIIAPQSSPIIVQTLHDKAADMGAPVTDCRYQVSDNGFVVNGISFPKPNLMGEHQYANAATAIAALKKQTRFNITDDAMHTGLQNAEWPARLQQLSKGPLVDMLPPGYELWLDGGHNDSAGEALAQWAREEQRPMLVIAGMLSTKHPREFLAPLAPYISALAGIPIPGEEKSLTGQAMAKAAREAGIKTAQGAENAETALIWLLSSPPRPARILITGSLYLAGQILNKNT